MNNATPAGKHLERLRLDPDFRRLWYTAYTNKSKLRECINEARKTFNLSPAWQDIFLPVIFSEAPSNSIAINLDIPQEIHEKKDPVTDLTYYSLPIYPESTLAEVKKAYSKIIKQYNAEERKVNIRQSDPKIDKIQYFALELHRAGKDHKEIADEINEEYDTFYTKEEIPLLMQRARKKSLR